MWETRIVRLILLSRLRRVSYMTMHIIYTYCVIAIMRQIIDDTLSRYGESDFI